MSSGPSLDYVPSLSSSLAPSASTPSEPATLLRSVLSFSTSTSSSNRPRRSVSLLGRIPKDFTSLVRSHSTSSAARRQSFSSKPDPPSVHFADYDHLQSFNQTTDMYASQEDDRPTRKGRKSENKFYHFLTAHSRSRSRSRKPDLSNPNSTSALPELTRDFPSDATSSSTHSRQSSISSRGQVEDSPKSVASKRSSIIRQSRPLSTTTTATNATITPTTPKARRQISSIPIPSTKSPPPLFENEEPSPVSQPPTPPKPPRRKLHHLFGLSSSRKSSLSSQDGIGPSSRLTSVVEPSSPRASTLRGPAADIPSKSWMPRQPANTNNPIAGPGRRPSMETRDEVNPPVSTATSGSTTLDTSPKPSKFFVGNGLRVSHPRPKASLSQLPSSTFSTTSTSPTSSLPAPPSTSRIPPPLPIGRSQSDSSYPRGGTSTFGVASHGHRQQNITPLPSTSRIPPFPGHVPPTPDKEPSNVPGIVGNSHSRVSMSAVSEASHAHSPPRTQGKGSSDCANRYRPPMAIVDEEDSDIVRRKSRPEEGDGNEGTKIKGHQHHRSLALPSKTTKSTNPTASMRATKHGSFDFERPAWGAGVSRSVSGGSTSAKGAYSSRESLGNGGTEVSRMTGGWTTGETERPSLAERRRNRAKKSSPKTHLTPLQPDHTGASTATSHSHSTSGEPNSFGRSSGKKVLGGGITRLMGGSHGPFPFEPPVPSPTTSNMSVSTKDSRTSVVERIKEKHRMEREMERQRERERERELEMAKELEKVRGKERRGGVKRISVDHAIASPASSDLDVSHRSTRNRSLDLELGLSWAPTKIKETALLPFGKGRPSLSASSRNGLRRELDDRSKVGKEIADEFRRVLDEDGYALFKHYVHCFDAHEIPIEGPTGIIAHAERLLDSASSLSLIHRRQLLDKLVRIILQRA